MITNIVAVITIIITTNTYQPTQYWQPYGITYGYHPTVETDEIGSWSDSRPVWTPQGFQLRTRSNPDVQYVELHEVRKYEYEIEGKSQTYIAEDKLLSKTKRTRKVETNESWTTEIENLSVNIITTNGFIIWGQVFTNIWTNVGGNVVTSGVWNLEVK